jgi:hypothetical protein
VVITTATAPSPGSSRSRGRFAADPSFGSAKEAYDRSGLTEEDIDRALAPMSDEELREWCIIDSQRTSLPRARSSVFYQAGAPLPGRSRH